MKCRYCFGTIPKERGKLRGRRGDYCCDDHHERDLKHERGVESGRKRFIRGR